MRVINPTKLILNLALALSLAFTARHGQAQGTTTEQATIEAVMDAQVTAWNKGNVSAFMLAYENSPETTFIGATVNKGYQPILERYKKAYSTQEQMGTLTFHDSEVRLLPSSNGSAEYAIVTGHFHLDRTAHGAAAKDDGIFSLVWHKGPNGWKILLDHTS